MKEVVIGIFVLGLFLGGVWGIAEFGFQLDSHFRPKYEQLNTDTFHHSQMYNDGMATELADYMLQWNKATPDQKTTLQQVINQRYGGYQIQNLPPHLQMFLNEVHNFNN